MKITLNSHKSSLLRFVKSMNKRKDSIQRTKQKFFCDKREKNENKKPHDCRIEKHAMSMSRSRNMSRNIS